MVRSAADCQRCHHTGTAREQCATCHSSSSLRQPLNSRPRSLRLSINNATQTRSIAFDHSRHGSLACVQCHTNPVSRAPEDGVCANCHDNHHQPTATCTTCHAGAGALAKHTVAAHTACATCHGEKAARLQPTREFCLVCHSAQVRHQPGKVCETCHHVTTAARR
jgi:hypothetical protein